MFYELVRVIILLLSAYGFYTLLMDVEKGFGKKTALIVTLIFGGLAIIGLFIRPNIGM